MGNKFLFVYGFQTYEIPEGMRSGLDLYVNYRINPGGFLTAIIQNDLMNAVGLADDANMSNIPAFVNYFYNHAPSTCWGSPEKMKAWLEGGK